MNEISYRLFWDMDHIKGTGDDATLVPFEGCERIAGWMGPESYEVPETIWFEANFKVTQYSDYPCNDVGWPLMSLRMLDVLRSVGEFPYRPIPVRLVNRKALGPKRFLPDGSVRPEVVDDRFVAVQLTEQIDVVDWAHSAYDRQKIGTTSVIFFTRLVLRQPAAGLPPLFRVPAQVSLLLVSAKARQALEAAGIRGVQFLDLPGTSQYKQD